MDNKWCDSDSCITLNNRYVRFPAADALNYINDNDLCNIGTASNVARGGVSIPINKKWSHPPSNAEFVAVGRIGYLDSFPDGLDAYWSYGQLLAISVGAGHIVGPGDTYRASGGNADEPCGSIQTIAPPTKHCADGTTPCPEHRQFWRGNCVAVSDVTQYEKITINCPPNSHLSNGKCVPDTGYRSNPRFEVDCNDYVMRSE